MSAEFLYQTNIIRYLICCQVNIPFVKLPIAFSVELSQILGSIIANRLSTQDAKIWKKYLEGRHEQIPGGVVPKNKQQTIPNQYWPIQAVLFPLTTKRYYREGEQIVWELKLLGNDADHGFFLETILPALEELSFTSDYSQQKFNLWGHFDIKEIYVAKGRNWESIVKDGRLDLKYNVKSTQWCHHIVKELKTLESQKKVRLMWVTPFEWDESYEKNNHGGLAPSLKIIIESLLLRWSQIQSSRRKKEIWDFLPGSALNYVRKVWELADTIPFETSNMRFISKYEPGEWLGTQFFSEIPASLLPFLEAAAIMHIGHHVHFGCGTFALIPH